MRVGFNMCFVQQRRAFLNPSNSESAPNISELTVLFRFHYCFTSQSAPIMKFFWHFDWKSSLCHIGLSSFFRTSSDGSGPAALASLLFDHPGKTEVQAKQRCRDFLAVSQNLHLPSSFFCKLSVSIRHSGRPGHVSAVRHAAELVM